MPKDRPTYWPPDLFEIFGRHFYAKGIIGGMKAWIWPHSTYWITHGRFLLTKVSEEVLTSMFHCDFKDFQPRDLAIHLGQYSQWNVSTACYLAGILKLRQFTPELLRLLPRATSQWYGTAPYIGLALMNDLETRAKIEVCLDDPTCKEGAYIALDLIDQNKLIDHLGPRGAKQIRSGMAYAHRLRAGLDPQDLQDFKKSQTRLLTISTTPEQAMRGWLSYSPPRSFNNGEAYFRNQNSNENNLALAGLTYHPLRESLGTLPNPERGRSTINWDFTQAVQNYLRQGMPPPLLARVMSTAQVTQHPQDLIAGLEADWQHHLPYQVITFVYERLLQMLPNSDYLFESYAYALLMSGNLADQVAKHLRSAS